MNDFEGFIGGADEDRTRDLLTASFQPNIEPIEDKGLIPAQSGIERQERRNFRNPGATKMHTLKGGARKGVGGGSRPCHGGGQYTVSNSPPCKRKKIVPAFRTEPPIVNERLSEAGKKSNRRRLGH